MEFVNSSLKQSNRQGGQGGGRNKGSKPVNGKSHSHKSKPQQQSQFTHQQYAMFVNSAIQRGQTNGQQLNGAPIPPLMSQQNNGILQALQGSPASAKGSNHNNALGSVFQGLGIKNGNKNKGEKQTTVVTAGISFSNVVKNQGQAQVSSHEEETLRRNKEALLRVDPSFTHLYGGASQVAIYDYDAITQDWIDMQTVGCLFLYKRNAIPEYGLVVLNRKGLKNLVMFFDKTSQVIPHEPYLLFRRGPDEVIKCVWFYKNSEFHETTELFRKLQVQFDQCDPEALPTSKSTNSLSLSTTAAIPNLFDMLKQSQAKIDESSTVGSLKPKVVTAEELEQQMFSEPHLIPQRSENFENPGLSLLHKLAIPPASEVTSLSPAKNLKSKSGESVESLPPRLINDASRSVMRTVEQLENDLPESTKVDMSNELLATLGIKPVKDNNIRESESEINSPQSQFLTPTSRSMSESEKSHKKLTIDDLDGKLYEETDEDMVREVVENLTDLTELLLLSENVVGHSEPQLVWRKRSNLQNRPTSALIQVPQTNVSNGNGTNYNVPNKHAIINRHVSSPSPTVSPLTQNQLSQAITYLLQNDPAFVAKIHEGYVKSLQQNWNSNRLG